MHPTELWDRLRFGQRRTDRAQNFSANTITHTVCLLLFCRCAYALPCYKEFAERHIISISFQLCFNIHANKFNKAPKTDTPTELHQVEIRHTEHGTYKRNNNSNNKILFIYTFVSFLFFLLPSPSSVASFLKTHTCNFYNIFIPYIFSVKIVYIIFFRPKLFFFHFFLFS